MKFRLCVIGCGGFARIFAESLAPARDSVDLYFASRDHGRAEATQLRLVVWEASDLMKMLPPTLISTHSTSVLLMTFI